MLKQEMAQTGLFEKKEKLFEKDVDRGLELAETLTEKRTREYKASGKGARKTNQDSLCLVVTV